MIVKYSFKNQYRLPFKINYDSWDKQMILYMYHDFTCIRTMAGIPHRILQVDLVCEGEVHFAVISNTLLHIMSWMKGYIRYRIRLR